MTDKKQTSEEEKIKGSYKIICRWSDYYGTLRDGPFFPFAEIEGNGKELYISGLKKSEAEILANNLNKENNEPKEVSNYFLGRGEMFGKRFERYGVGYDKNIPLNKGYLKSPSFQELISLEDKFKEFKKDKKDLGDLIKAGQKIYVGSSYYISHGADDFSGGIATISRIKDGFVKIAENPGREYGLEHLLENQILWKKEYGNCKAHRSPDYSPEFNGGD